jgi:hypothetical protein
MAHLDATMNPRRWLGSVHNFSNACRCPARAMTNVLTELFCGDNARSSCDIPRDHSLTRCFKTRLQNKGEIRVGVQAPFWLERRRSAGSVASLISPRWRCFWHQTNQPGSPAKSFVPQAVSLWPSERPRMKTQPEEFDLVILGGGTAKVASYFRRSKEFGITHRSG